MVDTDNKVTANGQATNSSWVLQAESLSKRYSQGDLSVDVLDNVSLNIGPRERVAIIGSSGSGKSTLLHLLGGVDTPTSGEVHIDGQALSKLSQAARGKLRNAQVGFVYQFHHLLPEFSALENVAMPLLISGKNKSAASDHAAELLKRVGLAERVRHKPAELSGGERQRAAIARALVMGPKIVLADEPTGNLDEQTAEKVYELMLELNQELDTSLLIVTHDSKLAARMERIFRLTNGVLKPEP